MQIRSSTNLRNRFKEVFWLSLFRKFLGLHQPFKIFFDVILGRLFVQEIRLFIIPIPFRKQHWGYLLMKMSYIWIKFWNLTSLSDIWINFWNLASLSDDLSHCKAAPSMQFLLVMFFRFESLVLISFSKFFLFVCFRWEIEPWAFPPKSSSQGF